VQCCQPGNAIVQLERVVRVRTALMKDTGLRFIPNVRRGERTVGGVGIFPIGNCNSQVDVG
jgi:hypothetical protein